MSRRGFLGLAAGSAILGALGGCAARAAAPPAPGGPSPVRGICFDLFTLFDPRGVLRAVESVLGAGPEAQALWDQWRVRQFEYSWLRAAAGRYTDFESVTRDALAFAARSRGVALKPQAAERLVEAYSELEPWPDTRGALAAWKQQGLKLAPLANYSPRMIANLMNHAALAPLFDAFISTDAAHTFKPDPRAYALGPSTLGLHREELVFAAFGGWDAAGASWYGFPTFWVNRLSVAPEQLDPGPAASGPTFAELAAFVASRTTAAG